jgi:hypothetical protein
MTLQARGQHMVDDIVGSGRMMVLWARGWRRFREDDGVAGSGMARGR